METIQKTATHKTAYLHFGGPFTIDGNGPRLSFEVEISERLLPWQKRGLMYTRTGYGSKIPTSYIVKHKNRWHRVYCCIYSNSGVFYIGKGPGKAIATVDIY